jgi:hypothetical protein
MKKFAIIGSFLVFGALLAGIAWGVQDCATIQGGTITDVKNRPLSLGYDEWGYNYEAHIFNGPYGNYSRPDTPVDTGDELIMKWNDAWLSNKDCDGDNKLDRPITYKGSGAWCTNHQSGKVLVGTKLRQWTYFCKIVAVPSDAQNGILDGILYWKTAEGIIIGPAIWGPFAITEEVFNDPSAGAHGKYYKSPAGPGLGLYGKEGD